MSRDGRAYVAELLADVYGEVEDARTELAACLAEQHQIEEAATPAQVLAARLIRATQDGRRKTPSWSDSYGAYLDGAVDAAVRLVDHQAAAETALTLAADWAGDWAELVDTALSLTEDRR